MRRGTRAGRATAIVIAACALGAGAAAAQLPLTEPAPEPRKARIAFLADTAIHTIAADGSDRRRISPADTEDADPALSPGGDMIAFARYDEEPGEGHARLWLVRPDGSGVRPLFATQPKGRNDFAPAWSPDGARIAFSRVRSGKDRFVASIVTAAADGSDPRTVYSVAGGFGDEEDIAFLYTPAWSPDGRQILFTRSEEGLASADDLRPALYVVPAAGGTARRVARDARDGVWSPDGGRIAFAGVDVGRACDGECEFAGDLFVMNADGTGRTQLTKSSADDADPSWSGDGERIVFHSDRNSLQSDFEDSPAEIYSIRPDGSCLTWLTNGTAHSRSPAFEPGSDLSSDPGGCGPTAREPLVETPSAEAEAFGRFPLLWLGRVSPSGLLLSEVEVDRGGAFFAYGDCGRFEPKECGELVDVWVRDLCTGGRPLRFAGHRNSPLSLTRGALLNEHREEEFGTLELYTARTWVTFQNKSGTRPPVGIVDGLRRVGAEHDPAAKLPAARLPLKLWRTLTRVTAAHRRLRDVDAVARRLKLSRGEVKRRLAVARRLAELGVKRRLGC
jgi:Tol biopolymer transport system component